MKVTVLGAGNGGQTLAGDLAHRGVDVLLYDDPAFAAGLAAIEDDRRRIRLTGEIEAVGRLSAVTVDIERAMDHADVVYFVAPSFAQEPILEAALPFIRSGQMMILMPGNFGSLWLWHRLSQMGRTDAVVIGETDTIPFACRVVEPGLVTVWGRKTGMGLGALPGGRAGEMITRIAPHFPVPLWPYQNVLTVGLANTNMIIHCVTMIMNGGRIENDDRGFRFYADGMTESVCQVMEAMDGERMAVGAAFGMHLKSTQVDLADCYDDCVGQSLREALASCHVYNSHGVDSPKTLQHRYLTEDVPYLLVPTAQLGRIAGVETPVIDGVITLAETINGIAYRERGRGLSALGLDQMASREILSYVANGGQRPDGQADGR